MQPTHVEEGRGNVKDAESASAERHRWADSRLSAPQSQRTHAQTQDDVSMLS